MEDWVGVRVEESQLDQASDAVHVALVSQGPSQDGVGRVDAVELGVNSAVSVWVSWNINDECRLRFMLKR